MRKLFASYSAETLKTARKVFQENCVQCLDEEISNDSCYQGLTESHLRFATREAVFNVSRVTGMRPRDVYTLLGGEQGAWDIIARLKGGIITG